jgi:hypothetical protein
MPLRNGKTMQNAEFTTQDSMCASDVLLPIQYFGALGDGALCSEQRLMLAVLLDAIKVLLRRVRGQARPIANLSVKGGVSYEEWKL